MELNKITTDALSLYGMPNLFYEMNNTIIYISYSNYLLLKRLIKEAIDNALSSKSKTIEVKRYAQLIRFVKNNEEQINKEFLQSDPMVLCEDKNNYIAIQKDTKNIALTIDSISPTYLSKEENDTIYTALIESTELLTLNACILEPIERFEIPIFAINIGK